MSQQGILADVTSPGGDIETLSGDIGGVVGPDGAFNVNLLGGSTLTVTGNPGTNTLTINPSVAGYPITPFVVGPVGEAGYTTIQSAIDAANTAGGGTVFVQPGSYTENINIPPGVNLKSMFGTHMNSYIEASAEIPVVSLTGNITADLSAVTAGSVFIDGFYLTAAAGTVVTFLANIAAFNGIPIIFLNCWIEAPNAGTVISVDGSPWIYFYNCLITENTIDTADLLAVPGPNIFAFLKGWNSEFRINAKKVNTLLPGVDVQFNLNNCFYQSRFEISGAGSFFYFQGNNNYLEWRGAAAGDPLFEFGAQPGYVDIQGSTIIGSQGSIGSSTSLGGDSYFFYRNCQFADTHIIGTNGRGEYSQCVFNTTSDLAITMSSTQDIYLNNCTINSTNNPAINGSGVGTLTLTGTSFINNSNLAGTLTLDAGNSYSGTYKSDYTVNGVLLGQGAVADIVATAAGTNGQLLIGATGADPAFANLTSSGGTITITEGANALNVEAGGTVATDYNADVGTASPAANILNILGTAGQGLSTAAAGNTVTLTNADATDIQKGVSSYDTYDFVVTAGEVKLREESNILYVGKHGNDAADGLNIESAFLTFTAALAAAGANTDIVCLDAGTYTENITMGTSVDIFAPSATLSGNIILADSSDVKFKSQIVAAGNTGLLKSTGTTYSFIEIDDIDLNGNAIGLLVTAGFINFKWKTLNVVDGFGIGDGTANLGHIHLEGGDIYVSGTGVGLARAFAGSTLGRIDDIEDIGGGNGTGILILSGTMNLNISSLEDFAIGINCDGGTLNLNINELDSTVAYDISGGTLNLHVNELAGIETSTGGTRRIISAEDGINNVVIGDTVAASGIFTTVTDTSRTEHAVSIYGASGVLSEVGPLTDGQLIVGSTGVAPTAATLTAGNGISITNGAGTITISVNDAGMNWTEVTGVGPTGMSVDNGYIANNVALVTLTLPATSVVGDIIKVDGKGAGGWLIAQNAGQTIHFLGQDTTPGAGGSLASSTRYDCITLRCIIANTDWVVETVVGNLTVV